jgi:hypothetical protein
MSMPLAVLAAACWSISVTPVRSFPSWEASSEEALGASALFGGLVNDPTFVNVSAGFRVLTRGGGGALIVRPFYERYFNSSDIATTSQVNRFGVSLGAAILF